MQEAIPRVLATMAPACVDAKAALKAISDLLLATVAAIDGADKCPQVEIEIPPTAEESLQLLSHIRPAFRNFFGQ